MVEDIVKLTGNAARGKEVSTRCVMCHSIAGTGVDFGPALDKSPLSGQIAALETEMGIRLFQRRPFQLTPAGRELYGFLAPFFGRLPEIAAQIAGKASSHLRLAAPATAGKKHLPAVISAMRKRRPDLEVTLREAGHREVMELLEREEVDLAISEIDGPVPPGIQQAILASLPLVLLLPPGAPAQDLAVLVKSWPLIRPSATTAVARLFAKGMAKHALS